MKDIPKARIFGSLSDIDASQAKDSGMALVLIGLILYIVFRFEPLLLITVGLLIVDMTVPKLFKPFAWLWFGFSIIIGSFVSRVILTILFFALITPIGLIRKLAGKDPMQLNKWKKDSGSVFIFRNHLYTKDDIEKTY